jgi:hypothetical protein
MRVFFSPSPEGLPSQPRGGARACSSASSPPDTKQSSATPEKTRFAVSDRKHAAVHVNNGVRGRKHAAVRVSNDTSGLQNAVVHVSNAPVLVPLHFHPPIQRRHPRHPKRRVLLSVTGNTQRFTSAMASVAGNTQRFASAMASVACTTKRFTPTRRSRVFKFGFRV